MRLPPLLPMFASGGRAAAGIRSSARLILLRGTTRRFLDLLIGEAFGDAVAITLAGFWPVRNASIAIVISVGVRPTSRGTGVSIDLLAG
jgi:hypothetical protein